MKRVYLVLYYDYEGTYVTAAYQYESDAHAHVEISGHNYGVQAIPVKAEFRRDDFTRRGELRAAVLERYNPNGQS